MGLTVLLAAPDEAYRDHIALCLAAFQSVQERYLPTLARLFARPVPEVEGAFRTALLLHDVGKLTAPWQAAVAQAKRTPLHAAIGAAAVWLALQDDEKNPDLRGALAFAVLIHHADRGLLSDGVERPGQLVVLDGLVDAKGRIRWDARAQAELEPPAVPLPLTSLSVHDVAAMARWLRQWSRGDSLLNLHRRRLLAAAAHQVIKVADLRAAAQRPPEPGEPAGARSAWVERYLEGGLLP